MSDWLVMDASVALKLVLDEELREQTQALFQASLEQGLTVIGPPMLFAEVTNAIHQRVRRATLSPDEAQEALDTFLELPISTAEPEGLYQRAYAFAGAHQIRSVYDCLYVVIAQLLGGDMWTADRNLLNALGSAAPWVRWIGDHPLP